MQILAHIDNPFVGGIFVVFYLLSITWAAPRIGNDAAQSFITWRRVVGIAIIAVGIYLPRPVD